MTRRLSLAGQLLALQVVIICVVLVGVTAVTVAQSTHGRPGVRGPAGAGGRRDAGRTRARSGTPMDDGEVAYVRDRGRGHAQQLGLRVGRGGARADRTVIASADPDELGGRYDVGDSTVLEGRSAGSGERPFDGSPGRGGHGADPDRPDGGDRRLRRRHRGSTRRSWTGWRRPPRTC